VSPRRAGTQAHSWWGVADTHLLLDATNEDAQSACRVPTRDSHRLTVPTKTDSK
jgi:hypothetical protein